MCDESMNLEFRANGLPWFKAKSKFADQTKGHMWKGDRREFLQGSGLVLGTVALRSQMDAPARASRLWGGNDQTPLMNRGSFSERLPSLSNTNVQTIIGLGDETPGVIDQYGQLDSRNATVCLDIGRASHTSPDLKWSQSLEDG